MYDEIIEITIQYDKNNHEFRLLCDAAYYESWFEFVEPNKMLHRVREIVLEKVNKQGINLSSTSTKMGKENGS